MGIADVHSKVTAESEREDVKSREELLKSHRPNLSGPVDARGFIQPLDSAPLSPDHVS